MKKTLFVLMAVILAFSLVACGGGKTPSGTNPSGDDTPTASKIDISTYKIYYQDGAGPKTSAAVSLLAKALNSAYGTQLVVESDFVLPTDTIPTDTNEILIGKTNRAESAALITESDSEHDWHISFDGKRLCAGGPSDDATAKSVMHLISLIESDGLYLEAGFKYDYEYTYPCTSAKINDVDISEFTVVYHASDLSRALAKEIMDVISEKTGITLKYEKAADTTASNQIVIGNKEELGAHFINDDNGYGIYEENGDLMVTFTTGNSAYAVLKDFTELFSQDVNIEAGHTDDHMADVLRVSLLGDSNTAMALMQQWMDVYLTSRYPDTLIELDNKGVSGDTAEGSLKRLESDVYPANPDVVIVCFGGNGMTENVGTLTGTPVSEIVRLRRISWYLDNMRKVVTELQSKGIEVIISSPVVYDEWVESKTDNYKLVHVTYIELIPMLRDLATELGVEFVDMYNNFLPITKEYREKTGDTSVALMSTDRKHANLVGALAGAFAYVEESRWASDTVASVTVSAGSAHADVVNADVAVEISSDEYISYTYKPYAIPITANSNYTKLASYGTLDLDAYNREMICVNGLAEGEYSIRFDGVEIATATSEELALGINIATLQKNPSQKAAVKLYDALNTKRVNIANIRAFSYAEYKHLIPNGYTNMTHEEKLAYYQSYVDKNASSSAYLVSVMKSYIAKADDIPTYPAVNSYCDFQARVLASSGKYNVEIVKIAK